jgi:hypothetical protein
MVWKKEEERGGELRYCNKLQKDTVQQRTIKEGGGPSVNLQSFYADLYADFYCPCESPAPGLEGEKTLSKNQFNVSIFGTVFFVPLT